MHPVFQIKKLTEGLQHYWPSVVGHVYILMVQVEFRLFNVWGWILAEIGINRAAEGSCSPFLEFIKQVLVLQQACGRGKCVGR